MEQHGIIYTKMKTKILLTIISAIIITGLIIAGGIVLIERESTISASEKELLNTAGIDNVIVENLRCFDTYCMFWITGNGIQTEQRVSKYIPVCIKNKEGEEICNDVLRSDIELIAERDRIVDNLLSSIAKDIDSSNSKDEIKIVGDGERVIIDSEIIEK